MINAQSTCLLIVPLIVSVTGELYRAQKLPRLHQLLPPLCVSFRARCLLPRGELQKSLPRLGMLPDASTIVAGPLAENG